MSEIVDEPNGAGSGRSEAQVSNSLKHSKEEKQWVAALNSKNCKRLMALLHQHPSLWQKKAPGGRTVLHVAVMQGCVKLVELVLPGTPLENDNQKEFQENSKTLLSAIDGKCRADAFQLSAIVGNQEVIQVLNSARPPGFLNRSSRSTPYDADPSDASRHIAMKSTYSDSSLEVEIIDLLNELPSSELHESLQKQMNEDVDYNFEEHRTGLIFNFACKRAHSNIDFLSSMASKAKEKPLLWQKLFTQMDAQGRTPLHVAVQYYQQYQGAEPADIEKLLQLMPDECVNGRDGAGRTPLMRATANGMNIEAGEVVKVLADDPRTDLNAVWPSPEPKSQVTGASGVTALHLAVLHNHGPATSILLKAEREYLEDRANVEKQMTRRIKVFKRQSYLRWTPLELAAVTGRHSALKYILQACQKLPREANRDPVHDQHCLHLAAAAGEPLSIQHLL